MVTLHGFTQQLLVQDQSCSTCLLPPTLNPFIFFSLSSSACFPCGVGDGIQALLHVSWLCCRAPSPALWVLVTKSQIYISSTNTSGCISDTFHVVFWKLFITQRREGTLYLGRDSRPISLPFFQCGCICLFVLFILVYIEQFQSSHWWWATQLFHHVP